MVAIEDRRLSYLEKMYCPYLGTQQKKNIVDIPIKLAQKLTTSCFLKILSACYVFRNWDTAVV